MCDRRPTFKKGLIGFNSEFSFSETGGYTQVKEPSLPYYLPIVGVLIGFIKALEK